MDEEQENQYYRSLRLTNYIFLVEIYAIMFSMLAFPISHFDSRVMNIVGISLTPILLVIWLIGLIFSGVLKKNSEFWYSVSLRVKAGFLLFKGFAVMTPVFSFSMILAPYIFMPDFLFGPITVGAVIILPIGPLSYFLWKCDLKKEREKYGNTRAIKIKSDGTKAGKLVEDALNNLKLGYREEKEGPKWVVFRDFYLLDSGIRIIVKPLNIFSSSIIVSNIPDDDALEKQIEKEILRLLASQS